MTTEQFTYWLQGFMEVANPTTLDGRQIQVIKDHLALVLNKQTPDRNIPTWTPEWPVMPGTTAPVGPYVYPDTTNPLPRIIC
jgi:hypothetical protein